MQKFELNTKMRVSKNLSNISEFKKFSLSVITSFQSLSDVDSLPQDTFPRYSLKTHNVTKEEEEAKIRNCSKPRGNESGGIVKWYSDPFNTRPDLHSVPYELSSRLHPQPRTIKRLILGGCRAHKVLRWFERDYPQLLTYIPPAAILGGWRTHW